MEAPFSIASLHRALPRALSLSWADGHTASELLPMT